MPTEKNLVPECNLVNLSRELDCKDFKSESLQIHLGKLPSWWGERNRSCGQSYVKNWKPPQALSWDDGWNRGIGHKKWNLLSNSEYYSTDHYLTEILVLCLCCYFLLETLPRGSSLSSKSLMYFLHFRVRPSYGNNSFFTFYLPFCVCK